MALIDNREDHAAFLRVVEKLIDIDPERKTEEGFTLRFLARIVEQYEEKEWPIECSKYKRGQYGKILRRNKSDVGASD